MTTDEKAKAYDMALEAARKELGVDRKEWEVVQQVLHNIFPELRESEDERISKEIINFLRSPFVNENITDEKVAPWIAWLEKQKENIEKEYVFRPLAGTDITIAAEQAIRRANEGDRIVLAFNGAYIPVRKGCNANKIVDIYDAFIEKQKESVVDKEGMYYYLGGKFIYCGYPATEENPDFAISQQEKQKEQSLKDFIDDFPYSDQKEQKPIESEFKTPDWVYGHWDSEYMINTVIGRYSLHAEVAKKRGDTHDYNLSKSMENWLRNVVKPLILEKQKEQPTNEEMLRTLRVEYEKGVADTIAKYEQKEQGPAAEEILAKAGLKPYKDGNQWCILAGDNIQEGICGFGDTIDEALYEFLKEVLIMANSPQLKEQKPEEKPINWTELTWKDIDKLEGIINNVHYEFRNGIGQESFGKEVLEKFREYKGFVTQK